MNSEKSIFLVIFWGRSVCSLGIPERDALHLIKSMISTNTASKSTCLYNDPSLHIVESTTQANRRAWLRIALGVVQKRPQQKRVQNTSLKSACFSGTQSTLARVRLQPVFALVAWKYWFESALRKLSLHSKYR